MPRASMHVTITDKGVGKTARTLFGKQHASVTVGVFGDKGDAPVSDGSSFSGITVAELAAIHEFGLGNVPERSFIRSFFDGHEKEISAMFLRLMKAEMLRAIRTGKPIADNAKRKILEKIGLWMVREIQMRIANGDITPPLDSKTVERKGSSTPLIDTGQLRSSITHETELR
jgi:hypothetical protein